MSIVAVVHRNPPISSPTPFGIVLSDGRAWILREDESEWPHAVRSAGVTRKQLEQIERCKFEMPEGRIEYFRRNLYAHHLLGTAELPIRGALFLSEGADSDASAQLVGERFAALLNDVPVTRAMHNIARWEKREYLAPNVRQFIACCAEKIERGKPLNEDERRGLQRFALQHHALIEQI